MTSPLTDAAATIERLTRERDEALNLVARLRLEAQSHASEAKTANATIYEIYQTITGAHGEPGNWNGARPVKDFVARAEAAESELQHLREGK